MRTINLAQAKAGLSTLLDAVEAGEEVAIIRRGRPVGRVIRETPGGRLYLDACEIVAVPSPPVDCPPVLQRSPPSTGLPVTKMEATTPQRPDPRPRSHA
jgi:antitoxin (DNA-binding transcriptional repressor) of toxin-antitoxin stability system